MYIKSKDNLFTMNKKLRLKLLMKSLFVQFGSVKTDEGLQLIWSEDGELLAGYEVFIEQETESGNVEYIAAPDGEYHSGETVFVIEGGICKEVRTEEASPEPVNEEPAQDTEAAVEDAPAAEEAPAEEPAQEPEFNAEQAIADLRAEYDAKLNELTEQLNNVREQLEALLALPAEENAFQKESTEESKTKPIFKSRK